MKPKPLFAVALCLCVVVASCSSAHPGEAVRNYFRAIERGDVNAALNLISAKTSNDVKERLRQSIPNAAGFKQTNGIKSVEIESENIKGDAADVNIKIVYGDGTESSRWFKLLKEGGEWKLHFET
ncbi:MAG TPA: DUF4878 domain-containing protein [Blastocatellia bacterium]|nr:DUF4878 domain-containing protein [Blastocatellia bacterium]